MAVFIMSRHASVFCRQKYMPIAVPRAKSCIASGFSSSTAWVVMMPRAGKVL